MPLGRVISSRRQYNFMQMAAHNPSKMRGPHPNAAVAEKLIHETSKKNRSRYARGRKGK